MIGLSYKQKCNNFGYLSIQMWLKGNDKPDTFPLIECWTNLAFWAHYYWYSFLHYSDSQMFQNVYLKNTKFFVFTCTEFNSLHMDKLKIFN